MGSPVRVSRGAIVLESSGRNSVVSGKTPSRRQRRNWVNFSEGVKKAKDVSAYAPLINGAIQNQGITHLLDYGCGDDMPLRSVLEPNGEFRYQAWNFDDPPVPAEMVAAIHVVEWAEDPDECLDHICELAQVAVFFAIESQQPAQFWLPKIWDRFTLQTFQATGPDSFFVFAHNEALAYADDTETAA